MNQAQLSLYFFGLNTKAYINSVGLFIYHQTFYICSLAIMGLHHRGDPLQQTMEQVVMQSIFSASWCMMNPCCRWGSASCRISVSWEDCNCDLVAMYPPPQTLQGILKDTTPLFAEKLYFPSWWLVLHPTASDCWKMDIRFQKWFLWYVYWLFSSSFQSHAICTHRAHTHGILHATQ